MLKKEIDASKRIEQLTFRVETYFFASPKRNTRWHCLLQLLMKFEFDVAIAATWHLQNDWIFYGSFRSSTGL